MKSNKTSILLATGLILMAGAARIMNHEMHLYNLAPVGALGLFSGAVLKDKRYAYLLPMLSLLIGDLYIQFFTSWAGFYGISQIFVYAAMMLVTFLGTKMGQPRSYKVLGFSVAGSLLFFLVSNFGVWLDPAMHYSKDLSGLTTTYIMGIPFFKYTFAGDIAGSIVLFGAYYLLQLAFFNKLQKAKA
ncbi:MAG: DUF6580 family putative transport protein [Flavipsychrobacter sp.]